VPHSQRQLSALPPPIRQIVRNNSSTSDYPRYTTEGRPSLECYRFQTLPLAPLSIKCFSVYLDSCILHVSYAPLSSWLRGTKVSLPTSVPWGQNNNNLVCTFAGPMPVVLVPVAHQLNPSLTLAAGGAPQGWQKHSLNTDRPHIRPSAGRPL
jgi:hypothetical protein